MRDLTESESEMFAQMAETDPEAAERMSDAWRSMSDEGRERFVRFSERLAALPKDLAWTSEQVRHMADNDTEFPYN